MIKRSQFTLRDFCDIMTHQYRDRHPEATAFMSPLTFREWWRGWASRRGIESIPPCPGDECQDEVIQDDLADDDNIETICATVDMESIEAKQGGDFTTSHRQNERCLFQHPSDATEDEKVLMGRARKNITIKKAQKTISDICHCILNNRNDFPSEDDIKEAGRKLPRQARAAFKLMTTASTDPTVKSSLAGVFQIMVL